MLRSFSAAPKLGVALAALVPIGFAFVALRSGDEPPGDSQLTAVDATGTSLAVATASGDDSRTQSPAIGIPVAADGVAVAPYQVPAVTAPTTPPPPAVVPAIALPAGGTTAGGTAAAGGEHGHGTTATSTAPAAQPVAAPAAKPVAAPAASSTTVAPADHGHGGSGTGSTATTAAPATTMPAGATGGDTMGDHTMGDMATGTETHGYHVHDFTAHVTASLGEQMLAPGQLQYGGYERNGNQITARSPITGVRPVAEQAIAQIKRRNPDLTGAELESAIAKRLTELNDWEDLKPATQEKMMILSGIDIAALDGDTREKAINHLQHSPLPFGDITEVLSPDVVIDLGYTHTLDKEWTIAEDQGNGVFKITMVSNNDNGAHTGHILGSFRVQLPAGTSADKAKRIGNRMVHNENNNDKLLLDDAVKRILYGETPLLDYSQMTAEQKLAAYAGKGLPAT